jgi:hypothetical protein
MKKAILLLALGCGCGAQPGDGDSFERTVYTDTEPPAEQVTDSAGAWDCLGQAPVIAEREPGRVQYVVSVTDSETDSAVQGLDVAVCRGDYCAPGYPRCDGDGDSGQCYSVSVAPGQFVFDFPFGLVDVSIRFMAGGYVPLMYSLGGPMVGTPRGEMTVLGNPIRMLSVPAMARLYSDNGKELFDPTLGALMLRALDCAAGAADGAQVRVVSGDISAPSVAFDGGFLDVRPQHLTVESVAPDGTPYAQIRALIVGGSITLAELRSGVGVWGQ